MPSIAPLLGLVPDQRMSMTSPHEHRRDDWIRNPRGKGPPDKIEQLDEVHPPFAFIDLSPRAPQILGTLQPRSHASRECLRNLRAECGSKKTLPQSYLLSVSLLEVDRWPIASRGSCDVYQGTYRGSKVCVKKLRVYSNGEPEKARCVRCQQFPASPVRL